MSVQIFKSCELVKNGIRSQKINNVVLQVLIGGGGLTFFMHLPLPNSLNLKYFEVRNFEKLKNLNSCINLT
jgi:hypothetical protein